MNYLLIYYLEIVELLLQLLASKSIEPPETLVLKAVDTSAFASSDAFLASPLRYTKDENGQEICLLKSEAGTEVGVMMGWEREISESCTIGLWRIYG